MSNLDTPAIDDLLESFDPDLVKKARKLARSGALSNVAPRNDSIEGEIEEGGEVHHARFEFRRSGYSLFCTCDQEDTPCLHVVTLLAGLAQIMSTSQAHRTGTHSSVRNLPEIFLPMPWQRLDHKMIVDEYLAALELLTVTQMRELAARRKIGLNGLKRDIIQKTLAEGLAQPDNLQAALASLAPDTRRTLDYLVMLGSFLVNQTIYAKLPGFLDPAQLEEDHPRQSEILLGELQQAGMLFVQNRVCQVPESLFYLNQPNPALLPVYRGQIDRQELSNPVEFSTLALRLLMLAQAGQLELEAAQPKLDVGGWKIGKAEIHNAPESEILAHDTFLKPDFFAQITHSAHQPAEKVDLAAQILAEAMFWESRKPSRLTQKLDAWLGCDLGGQMRFLLGALCRLQSQFEFDLARDKARFSAWRSTRGYLHQNQFLSSLAICRWRLMQLLAHLPAGEWFALEDALRLLHGLQPDLLPGFIRRAEIKPNEPLHNSAIFLGFGKKPVDLLNFDQWRDTYGQLHATILATSLHWLGLCDLGWKGDNLTAFRLSDFGDYLLGRRDLPPEMSQNQPQLGLVSHSEGWLEFKPEGATAELVTFILLAGEGVSNRKNLAGASSRLLYCLAARGLGRALEAGWDETRIRSVLVNALGQPLPAALSDLIARVCRRYGQMHIYTQMTLVRFGDDYCLPELLASTQLNRILLHTFSPRLIAVRSAAAQGFIEELRAKGYTPRLGEQPHD